MALSGDHVIVKMDDSGGTLRQFADGDIISVDLGLWYDQHDVTGFGDEVHNVVNGQMRAPVVLRGYLTTTANTGTHTVVQGAFAAGAQVSLEVQVGQNAAPQSGDPKFTGEFRVSSYKPAISSGGAVMFEAQLVPATGTAPGWGTV
jgi:hypothetical protein